MFCETWQRVGVADGNDDDDDEDFKFCWTWQWVGDAEAGSRWSIISASSSWAASSFQISDNKDDDDDGDDGNDDEVEECAFWQK